MNVLALLYLFLPVYVANGSPPLLAKLFPRWDAPIDGGRRWRGVRLFGSHKTWRGLLLGTLLAELVFLSQPAWLTPNLPWFYGFLLGFGALLGDLVESMVKRQVGIPPGKPFIPWDQLDYTLGALLLTAPFFWPGWQGALFLLVVNGALSASTHAIGHSLGILKEKI